MNSKELAIKLGVSHSDLMNEYRILENQIVTRRELIKCKLVIVDHGDNYLDDICESLEFAFHVIYRKAHLLNTF